MGFAELRLGVNLVSYKSPLDFSLKFNFSFGEGIEQEKWLEHRFDIVVQGNVAKFSQNNALQEFLLNTQDRILVEASPRDRIWGIGIGEKNPDAADPHKWRGDNLLGFALMEVRNKLAIL